MANYEDQSLVTTLHVDSISNIVASIELSQDGWLTVATSNEDDAKFVQASYKPSLNEKWYVDSNADISSLSRFGFVERKEHLPMKYVQTGQVVDILINVMNAVFGMEIGSRIYITFEIAV